MSVVDSSGWIEFLVGSEDGQRFRPEVQGSDLVVPTIVILEVRRWLLSKQRSEELDTVTELLTRGRVVALDAALAMSSSMLGIRHHLPLADSIVYATARALDVELWTQDRDFDGLPGVRYLPKRST